MLVRYLLETSLCHHKLNPDGGGAVPEGQSSGPPPEHAGGPYGGDVEGGGLENLVHFDSLANVLF